MLSYHPDQKDTAQAIIDLLQKHFKVHILGPVRNLLVVTVKRDLPNRKLSIDQVRSVHALLEKAGMSDCKAVSTPVSLDFKFTKTDCPQTPLEKQDMEHEARWYRSILASCIYLCMCMDTPRYCICPVKALKIHAQSWAQACTSFETPAPLFEGHFNLLPHLRFQQGFTQIWSIWILRRCTC